MNDKERLEEIKKELNGTIYTDPDEINIYAQFRLDGMAEVGAIEMLNSFGTKELEAIARFKRLYSHYFYQTKLFDEFAKKNAELNEFLGNYSKANHWGKNVIDVAMDIITKQAERVEELEKDKEYLHGVIGKATKKVEQNKRYRDTISSLTSEIKYALYSNKSKDVKEHYLKNAERFGDEALEQSND